MAMKATGQKVAREEEDAQSRESSPTKAQPPVQAAGEWLEQALLQTSCLGDHIPCAVWPGRNQSLRLQTCALSRTLVEKFSYGEPSYDIPDSCLSVHSWKPRLRLPILPHLNIGHSLPFSL